MYDLGFQEPSYYMYIPSTTLRMTWSELCGSTTRTSSQGMLPPPSLPDAARSRCGFQGCSHGSGEGHVWLFHVVSKRLTTTWRSQSLSRSNRVTPENSGHELRMEMFTEQAECGRAQWNMAIEKPAQFLLDGKLVCIFEFWKECVAGIYLLLDARVLQSVSFAAKFAQFESFHWTPSKWNSSNHHLQTGHNIAMHWSEMEHTTYNSIHTNLNLQRMQLRTLFFTSCWYRTGPVASFAWSKLWCST